MKFASIVDGFNVPVALEPDGGGLVVNVGSLANATIPADSCLPVQFRISNGTLLNIVRVRYDFSSDSDDVQGFIVSSLNSALLGESLTLGAGESSDEPFTVLYDACRNESVHECNFAADDPIALDFGGGGVTRKWNWVNFDSVFVCIRNPNSSSQAVVSLSLSTAAARQPIFDERAINSVSNVPFTFLDPAGSERFGFYTGDTTALHMKPWITLENNVVEFNCSGADGDGGGGSGGNLGPCPVPICQFPLVWPSLRRAGECVPCPQGTFLATAPILTPNNSRISYYATLQHCVPCDLEAYVQCASGFVGAATKVPRADGQLFDYVPEARCQGPLRHVNNAGNQVELPFFDPRQMPLGLALRPSVSFWGLGCDAATGLPRPPYGAYGLEIDVSLINRTGFSVPISDWPPYAAGARFDESAAEDEENNGRGVVCPAPMACFAFCDPATRCAGMAFGDASCAIGHVSFSEEQAAATSVLDNGTRFLCQGCRCDQDQCFFSQNSNCFPCPDPGYLNILAFVLALVGVIVTFYLFYLVGESRCGYVYDLLGSVFSSAWPILRLQIVFVQSLSCVVVAVTVPDLFNSLMRMLSFIHIDLDAFGVACSAPSPDSALLWSTIPVMAGPPALTVVFVCIALVLRITLGQPFAPRFNAIMKWACMLPFLSALSSAIAASTSHFTFATNPMTVEIMNENGDVGFSESDFMETEPKLQYLYNEIVPLASASASAQIADIGLAFTVFYTIFVALFAVLLCSVFCPPCARKQNQERLEDFKAALDFAVGDKRETTHNVPLFAVIVDLATKLWIAFGAAMYAGQNQGTFETVHLMPAVVVDVLFGIAAWPFADHRANVVNVWNKVVLLVTASLSISVWKQDANAFGILPVVLFAISFALAFILVTVDIFTIVRRRGGGKDEPFDGSLPLTSIDNVDKHNSATQSSDTIDNVDEHNKTLSSDTNAPEANFLKKSSSSRRRRRKN